MNDANVQYEDDIYEQPQCFEDEYDETLSYHFTTEEKAARKALDDFATTVGVNLILPRKPFSELTRKGQREKIRLIRQIERISVQKVTSNVKFVQRLTFKRSAVTSNLRSLHLYGKIYMKCQVSHPCSIREYQLSLL